MFKTRAPFLFTSAEKQIPPPLIRTPGRLWAAWPPFRSHRLRMPGTPPEPAASTPCSRGQRVSLAVGRRWPRPAKGPGMESTGAPMSASSATQELRGHGWVSC